MRFTQVTLRLQHLLTLGKDVPYHYFSRECHFSTVSAPQPLPAPRPGWVSQILLRAQIISFYRPKPPFVPQSPISSSSMQSITVETKRYDGGSTSSSDASGKQLYHSSTNNEMDRHFDAFSYYSSQSNRMSTFYGDCPRQQEVIHSRVLDDNVNVNTMKNSHRRASSASSTDSSQKTAPTFRQARKTKVSFEMHPSLLMLHAFELHDQENTER